MRSRRRRRLRSRRLRRRCRLGLRDCDRDRERDNDLDFDFELEEDERRAMLPPTTAGEKRAKTKIRPLGRDISRVYKPGGALALTLAVDNYAKAT